MVSETSECGLRVVAARSEQIVEQHPVAIPVVSPILSQRLSVRAVEREAYMAATVVDQIAGQQDQIRVRSGFAVNLAEVLIIVVERNARQLAFLGQVLFIHV